ncbi:hypothetical protein XENOCAPTIV_027559 [Xenoophorus captivus]|uniref:Glomulin, FKBP associated protein a n=1 Tax=Xenoophorus captivus TaxID=1517983 RepID=A0ABV0QLV7_9TELE
MALEQFSDVVQRCEALPNDSYTSDDHNVFTIAGRTCIEEGNSPQVLSIVLDEKNQNIVRSMGWNLLPPLIQVLLKKEDKNLPQCLSIFNHLLETCRPKELLIGLLEQLEHDDPDRIAESLHLLLNPLQKVLLCLGSRKASSLGMTLSTVLDQLAKLPVPVTKEQEEDDVFSLCRCCTDLIQFVRTFVQEARLNQSSGNQLEKSHKTASGQDEGAEDELRTELLKFCMKTLSQPLLDVQIRDPDTLPLSPLRTFASEILDILGAIGESLPSLLFHPLLKRKEVPGFLEEEVRYPKNSLASLAHLVFVHHLAADTFPSVFSPLFCLRSNMEHISILLSRPEDSRLQKGLELYEKSMVRVEDGSLPADLLEIKTFLTVPQDLVKVMTVCPKHDLRTKGLKVFQLSIDKFHTEAKYRFFQVMESLNLLRYLVIRDKVTENQTGIWTELYKIEDTFMKPLRVGLNMSRAHYERELQGTMENKKKKTKGHCHQKHFPNLPETACFSNSLLLCFPQTSQYCLYLSVGMKELTEVKDGLEPAGELHPLKT